MAEAEAGQECISATKKLSTIRRRLGTNLNRLVFSSTAQLKLNAGLNSIDDLIRRIESRVMDNANDAQLMADIESGTDECRRRIMSGAEKYWLWAWGR